MKNNQISKISMKSSRRKMAKFNLSHDISTTFGFGEMQPTICRFMLPDSKATMQSDSLIRLAPMNVPTFGRLRLRNYSQFVPITDIFPAYDSLMAQTRYSYGGNTYKPTILPSIPLSVLSAMCLIGADITLYDVKTSQSIAGGTQYRLYGYGTSSQDHYYNFINQLNTYCGRNFLGENLSWTNFFNGGSFNGIDAKLILGAVNPDFVNSIPFYIPIAAKDMTELFGTGSSDSQDMIPKVSPVNPDVLIERRIDSDLVIAIAANFNAFGKRLHKAIIGAGYQLDFDNDVMVSILPIMAEFKAYYDLFGLYQWQNYEDTTLNKMVSLMLLEGSAPNVTTRSDVFDAFTRFIASLGSMWYTDSQDFASVNMSGVTGNTKGVALNSFIDVGTAGNGFGLAGDALDKRNYAEVVGEEQTGYNDNYFIKRLQHSQVDSELLKRLYKWTNRNSIIGQKVAELLRAQGLGDYVDEQKSNFIGFNESPIVISDVVAQSDTYKDGQGSLLGEYGARGIGRGTDKPLTFKATEAGFWITLSTIVPDCGYSQSVDGNIFSVDKFSSYNPEFDGLGMEATRKMQIVGDNPHSCNLLRSTGSLKDTFGFVPKYSALKIANNKMNGDFGLTSTRQTYLPFTLDRFIRLNSNDDWKILTDPLGVDGKRFECKSDALTPNTLPIAGNAWRYLTRYGFLGNFYRIFAMVGDADKNPKWFEDSLVFEVCHSQYDCFLGHFVQNFQYYARMLPIEDSFETTDESNEGSCDMAVAKS